MRLALALASSTLAACSLFGLGGLSGGADDEPAAPPLVDAATLGADAGAGAAEGGAPDGGDPCPPAAGNLLEPSFAAFEDGCAMWTATRANMATTTTSHCGKHACRVCPHYDDDISGEVTFSPVDVRLKPGDRYVFSAWIRREEGATTTTARVSLAGDKNFPVEGTVPLMSEWGKSTAAYEVGENDLSTELVLAILPRKKVGASSPDDCIVVDDAVLLKVK